MLYTFFDILGVIGIVILVAFVIVFLSDLFISIVDGTNGIFFKRNKNKNMDEDDEDYQRPTKRPVLLNEPKKEESREEEYRREERVREENISSRERSNRDRDYEDDRRSRYDDEEESRVDLRKAEEEEALARRNVVNERKAAPAPEPYVAPAPIITPAPVPEPAKNDADDIDKVISAISKQTLLEVEKEELASKAEEAKKQQEEIEKEREEVKKQQEEANKQKEELENKQKDLEAEIEKLKSQIEKDQTTIEDLEDKVKNAPKETEVKTEIKTIKVVKGDKAELEGRLEVLRKRLKENEKELAANRKEYVPLRRVNMTLESDKKKLRRKEAIVAKQKVVLYGVNNYVDIDEERAKKLSEELDLLEGLRLSVQHCEEVMQKNKDRYPILERANKFLVKNNNDLKEDIKNLEERIAELEAQENKNGNDDNDGDIEVVVDDGDNN